MHGQQNIKISGVMSVRPPTRNNSASTEGIFIKFGIWVFFWKSVEKCQTSFKYGNNNGDLTWRPLYIYNNFSHSCSLNEKSFRKRCRENQNTHFMFHNFFPENCVFYGRMWKNIVQPVTPQMTKWCMLYACWETRVTNTHSAYVMFIAFPLQQ